MNEEAWKWHTFQGMLGELYEGSETDLDLLQLEEREPDSPVDHLSEEPSEVDGLSTVELPPLDLDSLPSEVLRALADAIAPQPRQVAV